MAIMMLLLRSMSAASIWPLPAADFPIHASTRDKLAFAARYATHAIGHTSRAWEFRLRDESLELWFEARSANTSEVFDDRETLMNCGGALEYLQSTLKHHGCPGRISCFPSLETQNLVARIEVARGGSRDPAIARLSDPLVSRGWVTQGPGEAIVPELALDFLVQGAARDRSWLEFARSEASRERLRHLATAPERLRVAAVHTMSRKDSRGPTSRWPAGEWFWGPLARWRKPQLAVTIGSESGNPSDHSTGNFRAPGAALAVVKTKTDDKHGWLAAGRAIGRSQLHARALGLDFTPAPEPLRNSRLRADLRPAFGHKGFVQAIVRFEPQHLAKPGMQSYHVVKLATANP